MVCKQFSQNPGKNPRTKRSISSRGKVYKALVKECGSPKKSPQSFQKSKCGDFEKNPSVNPYTNRKIKLFGSTFKKLISKCGGKKQSPKRSHNKKKTPVGYIDPMFLESPKKISPLQNKERSRDKKKSPDSPPGWRRKMITLPNGKFALVPSGNKPPSPKKRSPKKQSPKSPFFKSIRPTVEYM
jgi:hypothetical protein